MPPVQSKKVLVVRWETNSTYAADRPEIDVFMVDSTVDPDKTTMVQVQDGSPKLPELKETHRLKDSNIGVLPGRRRARFSKGRALRDISYKLRTCGKGGPGRPHWVFRVVHKGQPFFGIKARGFRRRKADALYFQIFLQRHFNWGCRDAEPSPFLSVTTDLKVAIRIAAIYAVRGEEDIRILLIRTDGPEWNHKAQRMWEAQYLVDNLDLTQHAYHRFEYLIENAIPRRAIIKNFRWTRILEAAHTDGPVSKNMKKWMKAKDIFEEEEEKEAERMEAQKKEKGGIWDDNPRTEADARGQHVAVPRKARAMGFNTTIRNSR